MSATDHTGDPMADRWEALTQAIRAERDAHRERAKHVKARARERAEREMRGLHRANIRVRRRLQERAEAAEAERDALLSQALLSEDAYRLGAAIRAALNPPTTTEETTHE